MISHKLCNSSEIITHLYWITAVISHLLQLNYDSRQSSRVAKSFAERRKTLVDTVRKVAEAINIPFTVGGGISCVMNVDRC